MHLENVKTLYHVENLKAEVATLFECENKNRSYIPQVENFTVCRSTLICSSLSTMRLILS